MARKRKSAKVTVDFEGVQSFAPASEGMKPLRVDELTMEKGTKAKYLKWIFVVADGKEAGRKVWHNTSLAPNALFGLKDVLSAIGVEVPDGPLDLDLDDYVDRECIADLVHESYEDNDGNNKLKAVPQAFYEMDEGTSDSEEGLTEDSIMDMSQADLQELVDKHELDVKLKKLKTLKKMRKGVVAAAESQDLI